MEIGITIRKIRKQKGIRQNELAEKSGISQTYLSQIEAGGRAPTIETLEKICGVLNIPLSIMSLLSFDINSLNENKREAYLKIEPAINAFIQELISLE